MSVFASLADLTERVTLRRLIELTDEAKAGVVDAAAALRALAEAENIINGYIGAMYQRVDAGDVPPMLTTLALDIAHYRLFRKSSPPDHISALHTSALKQLRDIADGKFKLDRGEEILPARDGAILHESNDPLFGRAAMSGF